MPGQWDIVQRGNGQISYTNPNAAMNAVGYPVTFSSGPKIKVNVIGTKSSIQYSGGEGSPHTFKAMEIAELIARKK
jgi:hypothetical protein